jgi:hypothetical protein
MNSPEEVSDGPPKSHREQADADLQLALWVLIALTCCVLPVWYLLTSGRQAPGPESFPVGTHLTDASALTLDDEEARRFDTDVFGTPDRRPNALGDLRLPPKVPTLSDRLWLPPPGSELATREVKEALAAFERCSELLGCDPRQGDVLSAALAAVSRPASGNTDGSGEGGPCKREPRVGPDAIQVPLGLHAIVLGWMPECRSQALDAFRSFKVAVEKNMRSRNLPAPLGDAGMVYARMAIAKLDPQMPPGSSELLTEMRGIRQEILSSREVREHYDKLDEVPKWGLSMAEIHGEWLMAEARDLAQQGRGRGLTARLAKLLDLHVLEEMPSDINQSPGQSRLRLAWCALALRAGIAQGFSDTCLSTLAQARSLPSLHCAVVARMALRSGFWDRWPRLDSDCSSDQEGSADGSARHVLERLAGTRQVWIAALDRYRHAGAGESEHTSLLAYLDSHANQSFVDSLIWFAIQHPWECGLLVAGFLALVLGWGMLAWAYFVRRPTLHRFLPPRLTADPVS